MICEQTHKYNLNYNLVINYQHRFVNKKNKIVVMFSIHKKNNKSIKYLVNKPELIQQKKKLNLNI